MNKQTALQKALHFFVTKIIIGFAVIGGLVALVEWLSGLLDKTQLNDNTKNVIIAISNSAIAISGYVLLFRMYEKREIKELSASTFTKNAVLGCVSGFLLQSLFIIVIYLGGIYSVVRVNPVSMLFVPFSFALTSGFVAEILLIGVLFRLIEEQSGTLITLTIFTILFAVLHINAKGATIVSIGATACQAGFMLPAAYVFSRSLWLPIFLHFSWDFAEPGIFGGINPSTSITQGLLTSRITGAPFLTGGQSGPQDSIQSLVLCLLTGLLFLLLAKRKGNFINPNWQVTSNNRVAASQADTTQHQ
jgi:membrane protease YdiL (CAAX protease family)